MLLLSRSKDTIIVVDSKDERIDEEVGLLKLSKNTNGIDYTEIKNLK